MKFYCDVSFRIALINLVWQIISPEAVEVTPKQIIKKGDTARFTCASTIDNILDYPIEWVDKRGSVVSVDSTLTSSSPRYTAIRSDNGSLATCTLEIRNVEETDAGTFRCGLFGESSELGEFELMVLIPRELSSNNIFVSQDETKQVGDDVTLYCTSENIRPTACSWQKVPLSSEISFLLAVNEHTSDGEHYKPTYQTSPAFACNLEIKNVTLDDAATYYCVIFFSPLEVFRYEVTLTVTDAD